MEKKRWEDNSRNQAALRETKKNDVSFCGGSILHSRFLLKRKYMLLLALSMVMRKIEILFRSELKKNILHKEHNREKRMYDIGLLRTVDEIIFT